MSKPKFTTYALMLLVFSTVPALSDTRYSLRVDGLTCPFCAATSEKALKSINGVKSVSTDLKAGKFLVCAADSVAFTDATFQSLFSSKGFTYRSMKRLGTC